MTAFEISYNMSFHPLLDWRLASDMLALAEGGSVKYEAWNWIEFGVVPRTSPTPSMARPLNSIAGLRQSLEKDECSSCRILSKKSLASFSGPRLSQALAELELRGHGLADGDQIRFVSSFELQRRLGRYAEAAYR